MGFIPKMKECFNIWKLINTSHGQNEGGKPHDHLNGCKKNAFDKTEHPFMINTFSKIGIEGNHLHIIKATCERQTNIIPSGERLKTLPLMSGTREGCPLSPLPFNIVLEILAREIREGKEVKGTQIGKEEVKLSLQMISSYT